jgi:ATP-dependent protease ClpP protease subunit
MDASMAARYVLPAIVERSSFGEYSMDPYSKLLSKTSDLEIQAREITRLRALMEELLARHTGQSRKRVRADIDRDTILGGAEAIEYGLVDHLIRPRSGLDRHNFPEVVVSGTR